MKKIFLILALSLCLVGCGSSEQVEAKETIQAPVECVYARGQLSIIVDTKTNVMYLRHAHSGGASIVLLVNADGTPRLYEGEFEDAE